MFQFLFKYPSTVFSKGQLVLLGAWPRWLLLVLLAATALGLGWLMRRRLPQAAAGIRNWRAGVIWALETLVVGLLLLLLWQPAVMIAELKPQQNIIAVLLDDSRSMAIADQGAPREAQAEKALENGVLAELGKKFQTRLYRVDSRAARIAKPEDAQPSAPVTRLGDSLKQLADETADLPIGAVVLLSDGGDNTGGIDADTIATLRSRHIPVHTVGFGEPQVPNDIEIEDVQVAARAMADTRLAATVSFLQRGYAGRKLNLTVRDGNKVLAAHPITLGADGQITTQTLLFNAGPAGPKALQFALETLPGEQNASNNALTRLVNVQEDKRRILYVEGEPRWEYKFIRRAEDDDKIVQLASMLRTTENKIYRQGIDDPKELAEGFPTKVDDLFRYQGLVIGSVEAGYFTPAQQELIQQFVDRRGGGLLLLGGRSSLSEGGWGASSLGDLLPVELPTHKGTFHRSPATPELTPAGADSIICRLAEDPEQNAARWKKLPYLMDYQEAGKAKPGATVLAQMKAGSSELPLLITQNYGHGRVAVLATGGTWRWQMSMPLGDTSHDAFWQQLLRWLVADTPGRVVASVPSQTLFDDGHVRISARVGDKNYQPASDAQVQVQLTGPEGSTSTVEMTPDPNTPGVYQADWVAEKPGLYAGEVVAKKGDEEAGRDLVRFQRLDGVAENFHTGQNRALLEALASQTGGQYWSPQDLPKLAGEISYSEAGITIREAKDIWDMPIVFLLLLGLCSGEWLLRRKWGLV